MSNLILPYYVPPVRSNIMGKWLDRNRCFDIMRGNYFFNHLGHNIVVIGCANYEESIANEKMKIWYDFYTTKRVLPMMRLRTPDMPVITRLNWTHNFSGPREKIYNLNYPTYLEYFDNENV